MLTYTMSDDGMRAIIGPCRGGSLRLSIIRLARILGIEIPPAALDETTDLDTLRELNLELLIERDERRIAELQAKRAQEAAERAARERRLPPPIAAKVAALRAAADRIRLAAHYAEGLAAFGAEMAEARHLEHEAESLIAAH